MPPHDDSSLHFEWHGERLCLFADKALFWERESMLVVSDLHFGKEAAFRRAGRPVPEGTLASDLARLGALLKLSRAKRLLLLGDLFHARSGRTEDLDRTLADWADRTAVEEFILVPGNHDRHAGSPTHWPRLTTTGPFLDQGPLRFQHEPEAVHGRAVIAGHLHPATRIGSGGKSGLRLPCYWFQRDVAVLPAFGGFTGTKMIERRGGDVAFATDGERMARLP